MAQHPSKLDELARYWRRMIAAPVRWELPRFVQKVGAYAGELQVVLLLLLTFATLLFIFLRAFFPYSVGEVPLLICAGLLALVAFITCFSLVLARTQIRHLHHELDLLTDNERAQRKRLRHLEQEMDLLTAMRDISRIVNDDVNFEEIWGQVFSIISNLVPADKIGLYLIDENTQQLYLRACYTSEQVFFSDIPVGIIDDNGVRAALERQAVTRIVEQSGFTLTFPLASVQEHLGVLKLSLRFSDQQEQQEQCEECERLMVPFLKHIALSIKAPTLYDRAVVDALTGLYTKRHFLHQITGYFQIAKRHGTVFSLVMIDIDHFKKINDRHGHLSGDITLKEVAQIIKGTIRSCDSAYRYGGEELSILLPETPAASAGNIAERVRQEVARHNFKGEKGERIKVTISTGLAQYEGELAEPCNLISLADQALYFSKKTGRNRSSCWQNGKAVRV